MTLYEIVKELQTASGSNAKTAILEQHKDNELLKDYLKAVYDPAINYYQSKVTKMTAGNMATMDKELISHMLNTFATRKVTGNAAVTLLGGINSALDTEGQELLELLIKRSIGAGVGDTMILKVFPDLYFIPSYQRCSLMDEKIKAKLDKLDSFIVQRKEDGSFAYLIKEAGKSAEAITRSGNKYPIEFTQKLATGLPDGYVIIGELLVEDDGVELDRKTGNGILNSILKGGDVDNGLKFKLSAWDCITPVELKLGKSITPYKERMSHLNWVWKDIVPTYNVNSLKEAYAIYSKFTADGKEGAVLKTHNFTWSSGTSKDCIKLKVEFECDLKVIGMTEGTGKAKGMMGSLTVASSDGKIVSDIGTGFSDEARKAWWEMYTPDNIKSYEIVITVNANDIIFRRGSKIASLFLPVFQMERLDKSEADNYKRCMEQLEAAKNGGTL